RIHVLFDRLFADLQSFGDALVRLAGGDPAQYFHLAGGELLAALLAPGGHAGGDLHRDLAAEPALLAARHAAHGLQDVGGRLLLDQVAGGPGGEELLDVIDIGMAAEGQHAPGRAVFAELAGDLDPVHA